MSLKTQAFIYQFISFAILFIIISALLRTYTNMTGLWVPFTSFIVGTILAPQFQAVKTNEGEKLFMKWIFMKGVKQLK